MQKRVIATCSCDTLNECAASDRMRRIRSASLELSLPHKQLNAHRTVFAGAASPPTSSLHRCVSCRTDPVRVGVRLNQRMKRIYRPLTNWLKSCSR